jgi:uncharacterized membrane protein YdjX (TVP38/TMEM64 family)
MLGALLAFLISRYWLGKTIKKRVLRNHKSFAAVDQVVTDSGWKIVLLLRLTPVPYSIVSYFLGVTKVKLRDYLLGTSVESVHIALWLYIGKSLERFSDINSKLKSREKMDEGQMM